MYASQTIPNLINLIMYSLSLFLLHAHRSLHTIKIKWNRNNITATMEKYEPTVKHHHSPNHRGHVTLSHPSHNHLNSNGGGGNKFTSQDNYLNEIHHMDYAYAYYEPGVPMRHQNIPEYYEEAGPSRAPPPNSIRALLSTARRNNMQRTSGKYSLNSSTPGVSTSSANNTQIGLGNRSQENVYEEIHDNEKRRLRGGESVMSLNQNLVEEEFRRVHNRHQRVLGELNLDVEEMLMPTVPPPPAQSNATTTTNNTANSFIATTPMLDQSDPLDFLGNGEVNDGLLNGAGNYMDLDSGFSGSNSSYIGSLRYQKTTANASCASSKKLKQQPPLLHSQIPINHQHTDSGSSFYGGSSCSAEATDEIGMISLCRSSSSLYESGGKKSSSASSTNSNNSKQLRHHGTSPSSSADNKSDRISFWKAKSRGWMSKLPGFSSTSSINKIGKGEFFFKFLLILKKFMLCGMCGCLFAKAHHILCVCVYKTRYGNFLQFKIF
jgi:hypothetical protein